jgi:hypothetical protein
MCACSRPGSRRTISRPKNSRVSLGGHERNEFGSGPRRTAADAGRAFAGDGAGHAGHAARPSAARSAPAGDRSVVARARCRARFRPGHAMGLRRGVRALSRRHRGAWAGKPGRCDGACRGAVAHRGQPATTSDVGRRRRASRRPPCVDAARPAWGGPGPARGCRGRCIPAGRFRRPSPPLARRPWAAARYGAASRCLGPAHAATAAAALTAIAGPAAHLVADGAATGPLRVGCRSAAGRVHVALGGGAAGTGETTRRRGEPAPGCRAARAVRRGCAGRECPTGRERAGGRRSVPGAGTPRTGCVRFRQRTRRGAMAGCQRRNDPGRVGVG